MNVSKGFSEIRRRYRFTARCQRAALILCVIAYSPLAQATQAPFDGSHSVGSSATHATTSATNKAFSKTSKKRKPRTAVSEPKNLQSAKTEVFHPAIEARITLKDGTLTIDANNSELEQILTELARAGGMTIDGVVNPDRVFGRYGPSSPYEVLTDLLTGSGYNIVMVGVTEQGVPRQLMLTRRSGVATAPSPATQKAEDTEELGPGAIAHPRPEQALDDPQARAQQNLKRLQQMREPPGDRLPPP